MLDFETIEWRDENGDPVYGPFQEGKKYTADVVFYYDTSIYAVDENNISLSMNNSKFGTGLSMYGNRRAMLVNSMANMVYEFDPAPAGTQKQEITSLSVNVTAPVAGATPATTATANEPMLTFKSITWQEENKDPVQGTFQEGKKYTVTVTFSFDTTSYKLSNNEPKLSLNGLSFAADYHQSRYVTGDTLLKEIKMVYEFDPIPAGTAQKQKIPSFGVNVAAPVAGATPATTATANEAMLTFEKISWFDENQNVVQGTFQPGVQYSVVAVFRFDNNSYELSEDFDSNLSINGSPFKVDHDHYYMIYEPTLLTLEYLFEPVAGVVENNTNPANNAYNTNLAETPEQLKNKVLTQQENGRVANGEAAKIYLQVTDISTTVSEADKTLVETSKGNSTLGMYLDINLLKQIGTDSPAKVANTTGSVSITVKVPENLINKDATITRSYKIVRIHNGIPTVLPCSYDAATGTVSFDTDAFSTYALVYEDTAATGNTGNTGNTGGTNATANNGAAANNTNNQVTAPTAANTNVANTANSNTAAATEAKKDAVPKTGENGRTVFWMIALLASGAGVLISRKKTLFLKEENE